MESELKELILDVRERVRFLRELGVDALECDLLEQAALRSSVVDEIVPASLAPPIEPLLVPPPAHIVPEKKEPRPVASRLSVLPSLTKLRRPAEPSVTSELAPPPVLSAVDGDETIEQIRAEIGDCMRCPLNAGRTQIVHSTGNMNADLMFVGEAPGADEDMQGFPFVGRAGQLLTDIIEKGLEIPRKDVFIGNINRCRPPGNRQPLPNETEQCRPFLLREVAVIKPKVIVVLGNTATQNLLGIKTPISKIRGQFQDYFGSKVMPTFHPAYLLRDPNKKRDVWEDMKKVKAYLASLA